MAVPGQFVTREKLERELAALQASERKAFANFNAVMGARQFCEQLLAELDAARTQADPPEKQD